MKRMIAAAATAALFASGAAYAQTATEVKTDQPANAAAMGSASQLRDDIQTQFTTMGIDHPVGALTMDQLAQIELILSDESMDGDEAAAQIELILDEQM